MERRKPTDLLYIDSRPAAAKTDLLEALSEELGYTVDASDPWAVTATCLLPFIVQTRAAADAGIKAHNVAFATGKALDILGSGCGLKRSGVSRAMAFVQIDFSGALKPGIGVYALELSLKFADEAGDSATFANTQTFWVNAEDMPFTEAVVPVYAPEDGEAYNGYAFDPQGEGNMAVFRSLNMGVTFSPTVSEITGSFGGRTEDEDDDSFAQRIYSRLYSGGRTGTVESYADVVLNPVLGVGTQAPGLAIDATAVTADQYNTILAKDYTTDAKDIFPVRGESVDVVALGLMEEPEQDFSSSLTAYGAQEGLWKPYQQAVQNNAIVGQSAVFRPALGFLPVDQLSHGYDSLPIVAYAALAEENQNEATFAALRAAFDEFVAWQTRTIGRAWSLDELTRRLMNAGAQHVTHADSYGQVVGTLYFPTPAIGYVPSKFRTHNDAEPKDVFELYISGEEK